MTELLIGCGSDKTKRLWIGENSTWDDLITLDINPAHSPDVIHNLESLPLPFDDNSFDEIHAYEVLEHTGKQGDFKFFFAQFEDFWRILKPDGYIIGSCPKWDGPWAWGDPGHKRIISNYSFVFLSQKQYQDQVGKTAMSDYRFCYKADFVFEIWKEFDQYTMGFVLRANKE